MDDPIVPTTPIVWQPASRFLLIVALALIGPRCIAAESAGPAVTPDFNQGQRLVFMNDLMGNVPAGRVLEYSFTSSGKDGESFADRVKVTVSRVADDGRRDMQFDFLTGAHHLDFHAVDSLEPNGGATTPVAEAAPASVASQPTAPCPTSYPTSVLADYVLGCMIANGQSPETLRKCACSVDFIAAAIPYPEYERVETLMRLQQLEGVGRNAAYKGAPWAKAAVTHFKEVQAESTLRCF